MSRDDKQKWSSESLWAIYKAEEDVCGAKIDTLVIWSSLIASLIQRRNSKVLFSSILTKMMRIK